MTDSDSLDENMERLAEERDLFEKIVDEDGPFAPEAEKVLAAIDAWERDEL